MKILIVEDSDAGAAMKVFMNRMFPPDQVQVTLFTDLVGVPEFVKKERPEIIVLDLGLPDVTLDDMVTEFIPALAAVSEVMVCSARIESNTLRRCILAGANDYIRKDELFADGFDKVVTKFRSRLESAYYRNVRSHGTINSPAPSIPFPTGLKSSLPVTEERVY